MGKSKGIGKTGKNDKVHWAGERGLFFGKILKEKKWSDPLIESMNLREFSNVTRRKKFSVYCSSDKNDNNWEVFKRYMLSIIH